MTKPQSDLTPVQAADALAWLVDMGADEIVLDEPVNRLVAPPPLQPTEPLPGAPPRPEPRQSTVSPQRAAPPPVAVWAATANADDLLAEAASRATACQTLADIAAALAGFEAHPLKKTASNLCFFAGATQPQVLLLSDRPRSEEDRSGEVLAGKHQLLAERMLAAIGLRCIEQRDNAEQILMVNLIPWRPPGNRAPTDLEINLCLPFARRLIEIVAPKAILCFSALPGQVLAGGEDSIPKARGKWLSVDAGGRSIPLITTFHPETLLKSPGSKRLAWHDLLAFRDRLERP